MNLQNNYFLAMGEPLCFPFLDREVIFIFATTSRLVPRHKQVMKLKMKSRNNGTKPYSLIHL
jgi:hypothetical protein